MTNMYPPLDLTTDAAFLFILVAVAEYVASVQTMCAAISRSVVRRTDHNKEHAACPIDSYVRNTT
jgi:hypothetical protein